FVSHPSTSVYAAARTIQSGRLDCTQRRTCSGSRISASRELKPSTWSGRVHSRSRYLPSRPEAPKISTRSPPGRSEPSRLRAAALPPSRWDFVLGNWDFPITSAGLVIGRGQNRLRRPLFQRILHEAPQGADTVFPADFFPFLVGSAGIADTDLINPQFPFGNFYRNLRLKTEAIFLERNGLDDFPAEYLVAGFHVCKVQIGDSIGQRREQPVSDAVPEVKNPVRHASHKARPVNHIRFPLQQWLDQQ